MSFLEPNLNLDSQNELTNDTWVDSTTYWMIKQILKKYDIASVDIRSSFTCMVCTTYGVLHTSKRYNQN